MTRNPNIEDHFGDAPVTDEQYARIEVAWKLINKQYPDERETISGDLTYDRQEDRHVALAAAVKVALDSSALRDIAYAKIQAAHAYRMALAALDGAILTAEGTPEEIAKNTGVNLSRVRSTLAGRPLIGYEIPGK